MSFFGFETSDLEKEKQEFLEKGAANDEKIDVYTWGEESYDGLGDALQEGGDELNDETFGGAGAVGKDFDFGSTALPGDEERQQISQVQAQTRGTPKELAQPRSSGFTPKPIAPPLQSAPSLGSIWDRKPSAQPQAPIQKPMTFSPFDSDDAPAPMHRGAAQSGTLEEIEAEMRMRAQENRMLAERQLQQQMLLREQEERLLLQRQQEEEYRRQRHLLQAEQLQRAQIEQQREQQYRQILLQRQLEQEQALRQEQLAMQQRQAQAELQRQLQQRRAQELSDQMRIEEIERQLRAQHIAAQLQGNRQSPFDQHRRLPSGHGGVGTLADLHGQLIAEQQRAAARRQRSQSPFQITPEMLQMLSPQERFQLQQRLLNEAAQAEVMQGMSPAEQELLRDEARRKIIEAERMEEKRRRKASKLHCMARYNDLMTQSDKDFITRIQVSQLVSQDPFNDDFYAQVYAAIVRSRMGLHAQDERVLKFGNVGGVGLGFSQGHRSRRPNAMQRMEQQVERIISNARKREEEKSQHSLHALQGALGKTSGRSYKAAPRQLLQVDSSGSDAHAHISKDDAKDAAAEAAKLGREALGITGESNGIVARKPFTTREVLMRLEHLYDVVMQAERLNNSRVEEGEEGFEEWQAEYDKIREQLANGIELSVPLEACDPPPFISLLGPTKGKRLLPRLTRHLTTETSLAMVALLVAGFDKLDVVRNAPLLDLPPGTPGQAEAEAQTQAFLLSVMQSLLPIVANLELRLVTGMLSVLVTRTDVPAIARSRPGLALFTLLLSRVEVIREQSASGAIASPPDEDWTSFHTIYAHFVELLLPHLPSLFPSMRQQAPVGERMRTDVIDQPVWQFLAALFILAQGEQTTALLAAVRHKVLDEVSMVKKGWVADEEEATTKINNVNLVLHSLGLDATQISVLQ